MKPTPFDHDGSARPADFARTAALLRQAPLPPIPADFARRLQARVDDLAEQAKLEDGLTTALGIALGIGGVVLAAPVALPSLGQQLAGLGGSLPMLFAAAAAAAAAWLVDRGWSAQHRAR